MVCWHWPKSTLHLALAKVRFTCVLALAKIRFTCGIGQGQVYIRHVNIGQGQGLHVACWHWPRSGLHAACCHWPRSGLHVALARVRFTCGVLALVEAWSACIVE